MEYVVGSLKFKTQEGLVRALVRNGAHSASFAGDRELKVQWPAGAVEYRCSEDGVFEEQLRWDFYADRRVA